jgi:hypothetical protein
MPHFEPEILAEQHHILTVVINVQHDIIMSAELDEFTQCCHTFTSFLNSFLNSIPKTPQCGEEEKMAPKIEVAVQVPKKYHHQGSIRLTPNHPLSYT